jgi:hypothetical protein
MIALVLKEVLLPAAAAGNYQVFSIRGDRQLQLGQFGIVNETGRKLRKGTRRMTLLFDATRATTDLIAKKRPAVIRAMSVLG